MDLNFFDLKFTRLAHLLSFLSLSIPSDGVGEEHSLLISRRGTTKTTFQHQSKGRRRKEVIFNVCQSRVMQRILKYSAVEQGAIISPLLFNAGSELAIRRWKAKLSEHGIMLNGGERLTNIRYADDLMLYAES